MTNKIFLGLGSNVGDKKQHINNTVKLLGQKITAIQLAPLYTTKPLYFQQQADFLNTVLSARTDLSPRELFKFTQKIEKEEGRITRFKNGPREIDIDILFYNDLVYQDNEFTIPHPFIAEREFVLKPFLALDPDFPHPVLKKTIAQLYQALTI